ncbi:TetR/AcrR family transcriptional regulator [Catenulispora yoronensis]
MTAARLPRKRDRAVTREVILQAAVVEFTLHGYARAGVRQIAQRAGVTAMLINRYFGSKEGLFAQAVERAFGVSAVKGAPEGLLSSGIARSISEGNAPGDEEPDPFLLMVRSAQDPETSDALRRGVEALLESRIAAGEWQGPEAELRAELGLALVAGTWLMRSVIGTPALVGADDARVADLLAGMLGAVAGGDDRLGRAERSDRAECSDRAS